MSSLALFGLLTLASAAIVRAVTGGDPGLRSLQLLLGVAFAPWLGGALFLLSVVTGTPWHAATWIGVTLAILAGVVAVTRRQPGPERGARPRSATGFERVLMSGFFLAVAGMVLWVISSAAAKPHGGVDAFVMWNLKARFLYRDVLFWKDMFAPGAVLHPHYPILLPASVAEMWSVIGHETQWAPAVIAIAQAAALPLLTYAVVVTLKGRAIAAVAGALTLGYTVFWQEAFAQTADVPLALCLLAAASCLALARSGAVPAPRWLALGGVLLGVCGWVKDEGLLYGVALMGALILVAASERREKRWIAWPIVAFAIAAGARLLFDVTQARAPSVYFAQPTEVMVRDLRAWSRHATILAAVGRFLLSRSIGPPAALMAALIAASGLAEDRAERGRASARMLWVAIAASLAGLYVIYLISPFDLEWHLQTTLTRLGLHLFPLGVLATALGLRKPSSPDRARARAETA